jgi:ribosomal-protein-alanine N-acetyltransferase
MGRTRKAVTIEAPSLKRQGEFLGAVRLSRKLHRRWADPPSTVEDFRSAVRRLRSARHIGHFICNREGALVGVININEIVRGPAQSAFLGYYAFEPHAGHGYMREALAQVIALAFGDYGLHRLEANIQPGNARSIQLVQRLGFKREGFSPRYLKIGGKWRDHERWALTREAWRRRRQSS